MLRIRPMFVCVMCNLQCGCVWVCMCVCVCVCALCVLGVGICESVWLMDHNKKGMGTKLCLDNTFDLGNLTNPKKLC